MNGYRWLLFPVLLCSFAACGEVPEKKHRARLDSDETSTPTNDKTVEIAPPQPDGMPNVASDAGVAAPELQQDAAAAPDAAPEAALPPSGPTGPFGSDVGQTAENFVLNDCEDVPFDLHAQYEAYPAVVIFYNWTGFS